MLLKYYGRSEQHIGGWGEYFKMLA